MEPIGNNKFIRLASKSRKGDINASYELYSLYHTGKFLEKDDLKAKEYLNLALEQFSQQKIEISNLSLLNFRIIDRFNLNSMNSQILVFVGNNGAGKTTVLDAISHSLSWLIQRIVHNGGRGKEIDKTDISLDNKDGYCSIIAEVKLNKNYNSKLELCEVEEGSTVNKKSHYSSFNKLGKLYKLACENNKKFELPLFAYYGVMRSTDINTKDMSEFDEITSIEVSNRFDGYSNSLSGKADFKSFFRWYKRLDDIVKHDEKNITQTDPRILDSLEKLDVTDVESQKLLTKLIANLKSNQGNQGNQGNEGAKKQKIINNAIALFMEGFS
ncbi:AAA family ATPase, partial [Providencia huaxiensis]